MINNENQDASHVSNNNKVGKNQDASSEKYDHSQYITTNNPGHAYSFLLTKFV